MSPNNRLKQRAPMPALHQCLVGCICVWMATGAYAQDAKNQETPKVQQQTVWLPQPKVGEATQKLLELQGRGTLASDRQYPMPAAVAERVYKRYVDSFAHPIPEKLDSTLEAQK